MSDCEVLKSASQVGVVLTIIHLLGPVEIILFRRGSTPGTVPNSPIAIFSLVAVACIFVAPIIIYTIYHGIAGNFLAATTGTIFIISITVVVVGRIFSSPLFIPGYILLIVTGAGLLRLDLMKIFGAKFTHNEPD